MFPWVFFSPTYFGWSYFPHGVLSAVLTATTAADLLTATTATDLLTATTADDLLGITGV